MTKFTKTKEWLIEEYVIKSRSRKEIANKWGLTVRSVITEGYMDINWQADDKSCELLEGWSLSRETRCMLISSEASIRGTFNDYPRREYTQVCGSARH